MDVTAIGPNVDVTVTCPDVDDTVTGPDVDDTVTGPDVDVTVTGPCGWYYIWSKMWMLLVFIQHYGGVAALCSTNT